jgi:hypothetical protein
MKIKVITPEIAVLVASFVLSVIVSLSPSKARPTPKQ